MRAIANIAVETRSSSCVAECSLHSGHGTHQYETSSSYISPLGKLAGRAIYFTLHNFFLFLFERSARMILSDELQSVSNAAELRKFDHINSTPRDDHRWLPIERVDFEVGVTHRIPMHARYCIGISD